jgi:DNA excision repair protein ERCC-4
MKLKRSRADTRDNAKKRRLNQVPDFLKKKRRIAMEKQRNGAYGALEDREREAVLDEALEETEHRYQSEDNTLLRDLVEEGNRLDESMFRASLVQEPRIILKSLSSIDADAGASLMQDTMPDYVVLYDSDVAFIRSLEVYSALRSTEGERLKVYILIFSASAEDKVFKKSLEREQNAFERLIHHKQTMPPPVLSNEGTQELQQAAAAGAMGGTYAGGTLPLAYDTRRGRGKTNDNAIRRDIAVDVREFRSALPSILHQGGMRLAPVTLTVGDFVLSRVHCIERKSISDLFGSFTSGRLYTQAEQMSKYYKVPALLIEFDPFKTFCLQNSNELAMDIKTDSICSKMVILTLHFPKLRILWSKSPHETLRLFKELKANHDEVNVERAVEVGRSESVDVLLKIDTKKNGEEEEEVEEDKVNEAARDMLLRLPGVNVNNARRIMRECESLAELSKMDRNELRRIAGPLAGQKLFSFFRQNINST